MAHTSAKEMFKKLAEHGYVNTHAVGGHYHFENAVMKALAKSHKIEMPENLRSCKTAKAAPWMIVVPNVLKGNATADKIIAQMQWCKKTLQDYAERDAKEEARRLQSQEFKRAFKAVAQYRKAAKHFALGRVSEKPKAPPAEHGGGSWNLSHLKPKKAYATGSSSRNCP